MVVLSNTQELHREPDRTTLVRFENGTTRWLDDRDLRLAPSPSEIIERKKIHQQALDEYMRNQPYFYRVGPKSFASLLKEGGK